MNHGKRSRARAPAVALGATALLLAAAAEAPAVVMFPPGPEFAIGEGTGVTWTEALASGHVGPVLVPPSPAPSLTGAANAFYSTFGTSFQLVDSTLAPDVTVSDGSESHSALVMSWDTAGISDQDMAIGAWDYWYELDPDLTGAAISFSLYPPPGIWDVSLELIDVNGGSRGWFGTSPANAWGSFTILAGLCAAQAPFSSCLESQGVDFPSGNPVAFDLTRVEIIRLDEATMGGLSSFPALPGEATGGSVAWNAWNHLAVTVPEPATLALFAVGLAGLGLVRRRRRSKI